MLFDKATEITEIERVFLQVVIGVGRRYLYDGIAVATSIKFGTLGCHVKRVIFKVCH